MRGMVRRKPEDRAGLGMWSVAAIGVGGMVGGGIFAVLGLAVELTGGAAPLAFALAGLVALLTASSYAKLSLLWPSQGGTVEFLNQAFGTGLGSGSLNVLLWISYVVMLALYATAFASYGASFFPAAIRPLLGHVFLTVIVVALTGLNVLGAAAVGRAELWIVAIKITLLLAFVFAGLPTIDAHRLAPSTWEAPVSIVAGGMLIFLAYEGFELVANSARDVRDPARTLPRAYYGSVVFVLLLYIAVALVTVGQLPVARIVAARDYALAEAAKPFFGQLGFTLIAVAAMLSTASAINATLYGAARVSYIIAKEGELPEVLEHKVWKKPIEGLLVTAVATLLVGNLFDLSSIAIMGSAGFLLLFAAVNAACAKETHGARRGVAVVAAVACIAALTALVWETFQRGRAADVAVFGAMVFLSVAVESVYRRFRGPLKAAVDPTLRPR